ncbi:hypothetical protein KUV51_13140 [Tateyamaria omphalii]|uniref:hypothetical protein n=1 Tax=Tateyamaria omphalii TaxID=299262 RepID=UPI001C99C96A|nr:hypothetical protein [Tateyamaria omphalii]MBY5933949.1 hypothetical protein [Tateyamaria omphalii]
MKTTIACVTLHTLFMTPATADTLISDAQADGRFEMQSIYTHVADDGLQVTADRSLAWMSSHLG